jgi:hypothetical protein
MKIRPTRISFGIASLCALIGSSAAWSVTPARAFDVFCSMHERTVRAYNPERVGYVSYSGPPHFSFTSRISINLKHGLFREHSWPQNNAERIHTSGKRSIMLSEDSEGFERYNLRTNRYYSRHVASAYKDLVITGRCRRMGYSGIAANTHSRWIR